MMDGLHALRMKLIDGLHDGKMRDVVSIAHLKGCGNVALRGFRGAAMFIDQRNNVVGVIGGKDPGVAVLVIDFRRVVFTQHTANQFRVGFDFAVGQQLFQRDCRLRIIGFVRVRRIVLLRGRLRTAIGFTSGHDIHPVV